MLRVAHHLRHGAHQRALLHSNSRVACVGGALLATRTAGGRGGSPWVLCTSGRFWRRGSLRMRMRRAGRLRCGAAAGLAAFSGTALLSALRELQGLEACLQLTMSVALRGRLAPCVLLSNQRCHL